MHRTLVLWTLTLVAGATAAGQDAAGTLSGMDRQRGISMLRQLRSDIEKHYYDPAFRGVDIRGKFAAAEALIESATSLNAVYAAITDAAMSLDDSHTYFVPPGRNTSVEYGWEMAAIGSAVFVVRVTPGSDASAKGLAPGDRVLALNRFEPNRQNLWQIKVLYGIVRPQQMQRVVVQKPDGTRRTLDITSKITPRGNVGLVDLLNEDIDDRAAAAHQLAEADGVMIWRMPGFGDMQDVENAARRVRSAKAVVLDLRGNGGGLVETLVKLTGYFFDRDVKVVTLRRRKKEETLTARPRRDATAAKLVVLVDSESGSAAEILARIVQIEKRGTVVGDRTAGAVMTGRVEAHSLGVDTMTYYATSVTVADVRMSDGLSLEKTGVTPDETVLPTAQDLAAERDPVLARAIALAGGTITPEAAGRLFPTAGRR